MARAAAIASAAELHLTRGSLAAHRKPLSSAGEQPKTASMTAKQPVGDGPLAATGIVVS